MTTDFVDIFNEINDEALRNFRNAAKAKITEIVSVQTQIASLNARVDILRKELAELNVKPVNLVDVLGK